MSARAARLTAVQGDPLLPMNEHRPGICVRVGCNHWYMGSHCIEMRIAAEGDVLSFLGATSFTEAIFFWTS